MIVELSSCDFVRVTPLLQNLENHPIINAVINGSGRGRIFVNDSVQPSSALIWAFNEMFYLIGESGDITFNEKLAYLFEHSIIPYAIQMGDHDLNLELYPYETWEKTVVTVFGDSLKRGERVPFCFQVSDFIQFSDKHDEMLPDGYLMKIVNEEVLIDDKEQLLSKEILKFWQSTEIFLENGIGTCILKESEIVGTCITVYKSNRIHEIGINTYGTEHRGKGLATQMAHEFIRICLARQEIPRWTTESFRIDSIRIANKLGFRQLPNYQAFYLPFIELKEVVSTIPSNRS